MTDSVQSIADTVTPAFAGQTAGIVARRLGFGLAERRDALTRLATAIRENESALLPLDLWSARLQRVTALSSSPLR